jgi:hypothetical protein
LGSSLFRHLFACGYKMSSGSKSGQPWCSCGRTLLAKASPTLRENWKIWEFICWSWISENQAYWHFCVPCHNREWPHLPRPEWGNRYTKPPDMPWQRQHDQKRVLAGVEQKVVGELYRSVGRSVGRSVAPCLGLRMCLCLPASDRKTLLFCRGEIEAI